MTSSIHEDSIKDTVDNISALINLIKYGTGDGKSNRHYSSAKLASNLVAVFPIITSKSVSKDTAFKIQKYIEQKECVNLYLAIQASNISKAKNGQEFIKDLHQNIDFRSSGANVAWDVVVRSTDAASNESVQYTNVSSMQLKSMMEAMSALENIQIYDTHYNPVSLNDFVVNESAGNYTVRLERISEATSDYDKLDELVNQCIESEEWDEARQLVNDYHRRGLITLSQFNEFRSRIADAQAKASINNKRDSIIKKAQDKAEADAAEARKNTVVGAKACIQDADAKRMNAAVPILMKVTYYNNANATVGTEFLIGVKAKIVPCNASEILRRIMNDNKDGKSFINILRVLTGELKATDMIFGIGRIKDDLNSVSTKGSLGNTWQLLKNRATACKIASKTSLVQDYSPITTVLLAREDADELLKEENVDILNDRVAERFLNSYNLTRVIVVDDSVECMNIMEDDGTGTYEQVSFVQLEKDSSGSEYKKLINLMSKAR